MKKSFARGGKGTQPFMPIQGKKPVRRRKDETVMTVGASAMIDDGPAGAAGAAADAAGAEAEVAALKKQLEDAKAERENYLDAVRRERADFDNYRKRTERDMRQIKRDSLAQFLKEFFRPLDDMDRVLLESEKNPDVNSLLQGVRIMQENFWRTLAKIGVKRIDAKGKPFDPNLHEAMAAVPSPDAPPNTVLEVYENGYKIDDFVLRPARVVVSRPPDA